MKSFAQRDERRRPFRRPFGINQSLQHQSQRLVHRIVELLLFVAEQEEHVVFVHGFKVTRL